jgi:hypothetical protein
MQIHTAVGNLKANLTAPISSIAETGLLKMIHVFDLELHGASSGLLCLPRFMCLSPMHVQNVSYDKQTETRSPKRAPRGSVRYGSGDVLVYAGPVLKTNCFKAKSYPA